MDDTQLKALGDALRLARKSRKPLYFSYVAADASGEPFLCVSKREAAAISAARKAKRGAREPRLAFGRVTFDKELNRLVFDNDKPAVTKRLQRTLRKDLGREKGLGAAAKALLKAVVRSSADGSPEESGSDELASAKRRIEALIAQVGDHDGLSESYLDKAVSRFEAVQAGKPEQALRDLERLEQKLRRDLDKTPRPEIEAADGDDGLDGAVSEEEAPETVRADVDWPTAHQNALDVLAHAERIGVEDDILSGLRRQLRDAEQRSRDPEQLADAKDRAAEIAETIQGILDEARAASGRDKSDSQLAGALEIARSAVEKRLSAAYQQRLLPSSAIAPFSSDAAGLGKRADGALALLKKISTPPDARLSASVLIQEYRETLDALNAQIRAHEDRRRGWDAVAGDREQMEAFISGTTEGKEGWDLRTLTEAMAAVQAPLNEALQLAGRDQYDDAVAAQSRAKAEYDRFHQMNARGQEKRAALDDKPQTKQLCSALDRVSALEKTAPTALRKKLGGRKPLLSEEQITRIVSEVQERTRREREALQGQLDAVRESQVRVGMQDLSTDELAEIDTINADMLDYLKGAASALAKELEDSGAIAELEVTREKCQADVSALPGKHWGARLDRIRESQDALDAAIQRLRGIGADAADVQPHADAADALRADAEKIRAAAAGFEKESRVWADQIANATDIPTLDAVRKATGGWEADNGDWLRDAAALQLRFQAAARDAEATIQRWQEKLAAVDREIAALVKTLEQRLVQYDKHSEIPEAFLKGRAALLDAVRPLTQSDNLQARQHAQQRLETYVSGGVDSDFPTAPQAMALFRATLARTGHFWQDDDAEADALTREVETVDMAAILTRLTSFEDKHAERFKGLYGAMKKRADAIREDIERDGLADQGVLAQAKALSTELAAAEIACADFVAARGRLRKQVQTADELLTKARDKWFTQDFQGHLREQYESLKQRSGEAKTAEAVAALSAEALTLSEETAADWRGAEKGGRDDLAKHIERQQRDVEEKRAREEALQKDRDAEWREHVSRFSAARSAAKDAGVGSDQLEILDRLKDSAADSRKATPDADTHATALKQLDGATQRLDALAQDPASDRATAKEKLSSLPAQWRSAVGRYTAGVDALIDAIRDGASEESTDADAARSAAEAIGAIRDLFDPAVFDEPVLAMTMSSGDSARQARERGLRTVRAYKRQVEKNPLIARVLANPFRPVPISGVHRCLNDLDLNILRSA